MSERFSTPDQADELANILRENIAGKCGRDKGDYFEYFNPIVAIPSELKPYLAPDPVRVGATVKMRLKSENNLPEAAIRLAWEYNPAESALRANNPDWHNVTRDRGTNFTVWQSHRNPSLIQRVSGMYEQPPYSLSIMDNISTETLLALADEQRLMAESAEMQAWQRVEAGLNDPRISFEEADILIRFASRL